MEFRRKVNEKSGGGSVALPVLIDRLLVIQGLHVRFAHICPWLPSLRAVGAEERTAVAGSAAGAEERLGSGARQRRANKVARGERSEPLVR